MKTLSSEHGLTYHLFTDAPLPDYQDQMVMFTRAAVVVAPHGAGLSNLLFSKPGTCVLEVLCERPATNMCFQRLALLLGMPYHALVSTHGCEDVINIDTGVFIAAVKSFLQLHFPK